jgi:D-alanyl-D-alanine carboxypeptidase
VDTDDGGRVAFSIVVNNSGQSSARMRDVIDRLVRVIAKAGTDGPAKARN